MRGQLLFLVFSCVHCTSASTSLFILTVPSINGTDMFLDISPPYNISEIPAELLLEGGAIDVIDIPDKKWVLLMNEKLIQPCFNTKLNGI